MPFKPHPTDPDKMVYESRKYDFEPIEWRQHASAYEQGFIDGMQKQMQSSVDKAVNAIGKREWVGLTVDEIAELVCNLEDPENRIELGQKIEAKLKEKNNAI